eukprot:GEZU01010653.1.p1 GENE.GEZU01010653.1~~GEZU01010653.1.p1  ORF type:complete len:139 (+),score=15.83 GEZU01010653.1:338-754(+)
MLFLPARDLLSAHAVCSLWRSTEQFFCNQLWCSMCCSEFDLTKSGSLLNSSSSNEKIGTSPQGVGNVEHHLQRSTMISSWRTYYFERSKFTSFTRSLPRKTTADLRCIASPLTIRNHNLSPISNIIDMSASLHAAKPE